jgi:hypothetical protein
MRPLPSARHGARPFNSHEPYKLNGMGPSGTAPVRHYGRPGVPLTTRMDLARPSDDTRAST